MLNSNGIWSEMIPGYKEALEQTIGDISKWYRTLVEMRDEVYAKMIGNQREVFLLAAVFCQVFARGTEEWLRKGYSYVRFLVPIQSV